MNNGEREGKGRLKRRSKKKKYGAVVKRAMRSFLDMRVKVVVAMMSSLPFHLHFFAVGSFFFVAATAADVMQGSEGKKGNGAHIILVCLCLAVLNAGLVGFFWVGRIREGGG